MRLEVIWLEGRLQEKEPFRAKAEVLTSEPPLSEPTLYSLAACLLLNPAPLRPIYMFKFSPKEATPAAAQAKIRSGRNNQRRYHCTPFLERLIFLCS